MKTLVLTYDTSKFYNYYYLTTVQIKKDPNVMLKNTEYTHFNLLNGCRPKIFFERPHLIHA